MSMNLPSLMAVRLLMKGREKCKFKKVQGAAFFFLLVRSNLRSSVLAISHDAVEAVWCKVHLSHCFSLTAGVVYRPPN